MGTPILWAVFLTGAAIVVAIDLFAAGGREITAKKAGIWTVQAGVFPENTASLTLHAKVGFRVVGRRERLGRHHGRWRDVLLLERRSPLVT